MAQALLEAAALRLLGMIRWNSETRECLPHIRRSGPQTAVPVSISSRFAAFFAMEPPALGGAQPRCRERRISRKEKTMSGEVAGLVAAIFVVAYNLRIGMAALRGTRKGPFV